MTIRFYILPIRTVNGVRGPKYLGNWGIPPVSGIVCQWTLKDYGLVDTCVVCADISAADHTTLSANSDVLSIPTTLDNNLTAGAVTSAKNFLESVNIPANWVSTADTYRSVLRSVTALFLYIQRVTAIAGKPLDWANVPLSIQWQDIPVAWRDAMTQAAADMRFSTAGLTNTTTLRAIFKNLADQWTGSINFGIATL